MPIEERVFISIETAAHALAEDLASVLREAVSARGQALLAVSGGHTPRQVFEHLCQLNAEWSKVTVTLTDERWVAPDHPDSNENLVRTHLLQGPAKAATFISLYDGDSTPAAAQAACEIRLQSLTTPFDAVYLGMGTDGHFASLFPGEPAIDVRDSPCVAVPATASRRPRMSLTVPEILNARKIFILFSGKEKHATYIKAQKARSYGEIPLQLILSQEKVPIYVFSAPQKEQTI
jgi:6-phosphogluconolactonase